jgi:predicted Fe-Mo cluster-binding NifX family protein
MSDTIALIISADAEDAPLSPFFAMAPWLMVIPRRDEPPLIQRNACFETDGLIDLIADVAPNQVICGHIPPEAAERLVNLGIDVRIGPCSVPAISLISRAHVLPHPGLPSEIDG